MKDYALELAATATSYNAKLNIMREYLQAYILRAMHDAGVFRSTAFVGGTALRFLYRLPRFSEDLDFSQVSPPGCDFSDLCARIKREFQAAGYTVAVTIKEDKVVRHAFVKISELLHDAGLSPLKSQNLSVKIEIDTNPPPGADLKTTTINQYFPLSFLSYEASSLFAGKLHALLSRKYTKGRDFFDLGWYLSRWKDMTPNLTLLENALKQTGWKGPIPTERTWRSMIAQVVAQADWAAVRADVENFLENPGDLAVLSKENVLGLLEGNEK